MIKIAIVQRRIAPFRIPFYERLNKSADLAITVFHAGRYDESKLKFNTHRYQMRTINIGPLKLNVCHKLFKPLLLGGFKVIVFEGAVYIISFFMYIPLLKIFNKKICWWSSGWEPYSTDRTKRFLRNSLYSIVSKMADSIIAYNTQAENYYLFLKNRPSKIYVAWNVMDDEVLLGAEKKISTEDIEQISTQLKLKNKSVILYVGKIEPIKKLDILIRSFRYMLEKKLAEKVALIIIGDGSEKQRMESIVSTANIPNVHFLGEIRDSVEVAKYFRISDVFVMPGAGGLAIYHAMVYGLPVVVSSADGTEADLVIDNKTGIYFETDDYHDLAKKITTVLRQGNNYIKKIGICARHRVLKEFPMARMVENFRKAVLPKR